MTALPYRVMVDSHSDYAERGYQKGEYADLDSAVAACQTVVDDFIQEQRKQNPEQSDSELFRLYTMFGEDPYIVGPDSRGFSAWDYAKELCHLNERRDDVASHKFQD